MSDRLITLIAGLKAQVEEAIEQIKADDRMKEVLSLHQALNTLEATAAMPKTLLVDLFGFGDTDTIRADEFFGLEPLEAAKRWLRKHGQAALFDAILTGIRSGGCDVTDPKDFRVSLARSTREIRKVGDDRYGLVEFYPELKRGKKNPRAGNGVQPDEPNAPPVDPEVKTDQAAGGEETETASN